MIGQFHSDLHELVGVDAGGETIAKLMRAVAITTLHRLRSIGQKAGVNDRMAMAALINMANENDADWERFLSSPWVASWAARVINGEHCGDDLLGNHALIPLILSGTQFSGSIPLKMDGDCLRLSGENWHINAPGGTVAFATIERQHVRIEIQSESATKTYFITNEILNHIFDRNDSWLVAHHFGLNWNRVGIDNATPVLAESLHAFLYGPTGPNFKNKQATNSRDSDCSQTSFDLLRSALSIVELAEPALACEVISLLRLVVPLKKSHHNFDFAVSFTLEDWPGAVFITAEEPLRYGELLVHETGHAKLYQIMLIDPLLGPDSRDTMIYSPWRNEPRPLSGILHGVYVHLRVARYYAGLILRNANGLSKSKCSERFDEVVVTIKAGISVLMDQTDYTPLGRAMVLLMDEELSSIVKSTELSNVKVG